jgi:hypothetical protein
MAKLSNLVAGSYKHVLVYGPPKSGKTQLAGELAEEFDLVLFDFERGKDTLFKLPLEWQERIEVVSIPDTRDNPIAITVALKVATGRKYSICDEHGLIDCAICKKESAPFTEVHLAEDSPNKKQRIAVFDSLTQLTNSAIAFICRGKEVGYKLQHDDWHQLGVLMDTFLSALQQAKFHVLVISHEAEAELEDGKMRIVPVAGTRNFSRNTAKYFDEVVYAAVSNGKHTFGSSTVFKTNVMTGSRSGAVLEKDAKPSLLPIFKGLVVTHNPATANTPAGNAAAALAKLRGK